MIADAYDLEPELKVDAVRVALKNVIGLLSNKKSLGSKMTPQRFVKTLCNENSDYRILVTKSFENFVNSEDNTSREVNFFNFL